MKDMIEVDPDIDRVLPLDPFGSRPHWASRIAGLGGQEPAPDPSYVFLTLDSRPAIGTVTVQVRFLDLVATHGTLLIELNVRSAFPGDDHCRLETIAVDLSDLAQSGGIFEFSFESYRNVYYAIGGSINDETDVVASYIGVTIDRRASPTQHSRDWGWRAGDALTAKRRTDIESALIDRVMTDLTPPRLDHPMSQIGSPLQCQEKSFFDAMSALHRKPDMTFENWAMAYILQSIFRYARVEEPSKILGYVSDQTPLLSYFAAQKHEIVGMRHTAGGELPADPGQELQNLWIQDLCEESEFFAHAHFTAGDIRFPKESFNGQFDVIWSINANRNMTPKDFVNFVVNGLIAVKPGGLAVHVFDFADDNVPDDPHIIYRPDVERLAALALSHHNDVARLQFRHGAPSGVSIGVLPFGIVLLRGGLPE
ncbi:hypothetical protein [Sphingobium yanoikuyae]|uniref:hypothetical protein n=1 Tax=Sphingobium yanoikuyae TaxID=13690 RepID=UPI00241EC0DF|nr:hypothetical protein [Sphingobium yanoikuyae]